jgi:hypothetical protein
MSVARTAITVLIVGLTGLGLWYGLHKTRQETAPTLAGSAAASRTRSNASAGAQAPPAAVRAASAKARPAASAAIDFGKAFRASTNYRSFVQGALPAAQAGDRDAQYYLHAALAYCDETYKFYFRRPNKVLSVDEAIEDRSDFSGPSMTEAIKRAYDRCHEINDTKNPSWGTIAEWLAKATEAGQPLAQMETAQKIFLRPLVHGGIASESQTPAIAQGSYTDARSLVRAAIETKDPQVIFDLGDLQGFLKKGEPHDQLAKDAVTWRYVACLRGLDCGVDAEWHLQFCLWDSNCLPGESGVDYLRRIAPMLNVLDLDQRAYDLNAKIDADAWDALGIGS